MMPAVFYFPIIFVSLGISYALKLWFTRLGKFDAINHRSVHQTKATKTGGISVFLTLFLFSSYFYISGNQLYDFSLLIPLGIMFVVGVILWIWTYEQLTRLGEGSPSPAAGRTIKLAQEGIYAYSRNPSLFGKLTYKLFFNNKYFF